MLWLLVPLVLLVAAAAALAAVGSLEAARRELQSQVAALAEARSQLARVQPRIEAARAAAAARLHR